MPAPALKKNKHLTEISFAWNLLFMIIMIIAGFITLLPVLIIAMTSFSSSRSISEVGFSLLPIEWSLEGYYYLFRTGSQLGVSYLVSIGYAVLGTATSLVAMTLYAYVIAQKSFYARKFYTWAIFFTMLFSGGLVPSYILNTRYLHIGNTFWIFIFPALANAWSVIILRTFLKTAVPESLVESARIDGAGHFTIFVKIVAPLMKAGVATIGLMGFVGRWNDWFTAMLYNTNPRLIPLQTMLQRLLSNLDFLRSNSSLSGTPDGVAFLRTLPNHNLRMACTMAVIIPILFAYPFFQRYFVRGMLVGSIKE